MTGTVAVIGGGAWGTALACAARRAGSNVRLWARSADSANAIANGTNPSRLPGIALQGDILAGSNLKACTAGADALILAVPAQVLRVVARDLAPLLTDNVPVAIAAKGIERESLKRMTEVLAEECPMARACVLSGPNFAGEVAKGLPAAVTLAADDGTVSEAIQTLIASGSLRAYLSDDPVGVEVCGAVKNVIAVAAGISTGRGLGENARAALVSRGLAEMMRLVTALGGKAETVMGLAGAGDLILTAMSATSRNTSFGIAIGEGRSVQSVLAGRKAVTEGYWTTGAVTRLAADAGIEMPIATAVDAILSGKIDVDEAARMLMERPATSEIW